MPRERLSITYASLQPLCARSTKLFVSSRRASSVIEPSPAAAASPTVQLENTCADGETLA